MAARARVTAGFAYSSRTDAIAIPCHAAEIISPLTNRYIQFIEKTDDLLRALDPLFKKEVTRLKCLGFSIQTKALVFGAAIGHAKLSRPAVSATDIASEAPVLGRTEASARMTG